MFWLSGVTVVSWVGAAPSTGCRHLLPGGEKGKCLTHSLH
jgi:hypothetical protein